MNKYILGLIILVLFVAGCSSNSQVNGNAALDTQPAANANKLEIYHFHGTHQCYSCKTVGAYAEDTINTYFVNELRDGKIVFAHINAELPENRDIVLKYGATGSSLWLGIYTKDGTFSKEENTNVWYKINDKEDYMYYLKGVIEQKLAGN